MAANVSDKTDICISQLIGKRHRQMRSRFR